MQMFTGGLNTTNVRLWHGVVWEADVRPPAKIRARAQSAVRAHGPSVA
jgi:hypothetical protein